MLTQVDVVCDSTYFLKTLGASPYDSLMLQSITGLGPPDGSLFVGDYARDGGVYTGRRYSSRNPVLTIQINPNYANGESFDGLRDQLYRSFMNPLVNDDGVKLILHDTAKEDRFLVGYTEKFEGEPFGKDMSVQISIICPDPFIRGTSETVLTGSWTTVPFTYSGNAKTGFEITIEISSNTSSLVLQNNDLQMLLTYDFVVGDIVKINTILGQRRISLFKASDPDTELDILYTLGEDSPWLQLHSITNSLSIVGPTSSITEFKFTNAYWGI